MEAATPSAAAARQGNAVAWFVDRHLAEGRGDAVAFTDPWRRLTYAGLADASARFAGGLRAAGIGRERRLAMLMLDTADFPVVFWGALRAGVVAVPVNTLLPPDQVACILEDSRAEAAVVSAPLLAALAPALERSPWRYQGRTDDMFKTSGIWVSPFEVEAALASHPAVQEAAVIGRRDSDGLLKPMAFVVLKEGTGAGAALFEALPEGPREGARRALEIPALDRGGAGPAEDRDRQDPALQAPRRGRGEAE